ncbi:DUF1499 domain-containing protein [Aurantiacibacter rhizosphaerae]|uniref:DUF1499 domain-containing protein n=1 Tax=Aurantiacibacter rhizosphaerae TaxID=2691582 RepID=A0A844XFL0_9SPHN|nr:DUF1499 domain-containing protein [Aurantiacibacter rhizosphaerae]MWV28529.1 DUF1499 domain-containing protein [Aurantiacibacter rhizosphaerae]
MAETGEKVAPAAGTNAKSVKIVRWLGNFVLGGALILIVIVFAAATLARFDMIGKLAGFGPFYMSLNPARVLTLIGVLGLGFAFWRSTRHVAKLFLGTLLAGALTLAVYVLLVIPGGKVPPIHDITTDLNDPPQFTTLDVDDVSTGPFTQEEWRAYHEESYADIEPIIIDKPPEEVLANARALAEARGWEIVDADPEAGILEATATAGYVRFYDDVVVEVTPVADGSTRVDMRSVSRVGVSDVGYNAARIRSFLSDLRNAP